MVSWHPEDEDTIIMLMMKVYDKFYVDGSFQLGFFESGGYIKYSMNQF
jgi:hypothetical protein